MPGHLVLPGLHRLHARGVLAFFLFTCLQLLSPVNISHSVSMPISMYARQYRAHKRTHTSAL